MLKTYIAEGAVVKGKVQMGEDVSIWYNATVRGDSAEIKIGNCTNVQDNAVIHVDTHSGYPQNAIKECAASISGCNNCCFSFSYSQFPCSVTVRPMPVSLQLSAVYIQLYLEDMP